MRQLAYLFFLLLSAAYTKAQTVNINGPAGSGQFGKTVTVLSNGNYVVTDPLYHEGAIADVGAVYLYNGNTHALISMVKGSKANDQVGSGGVTALLSGNFVVSSPEWDNGTIVNVGAVTWVNGVIGLSGVVSSTNSLIGLKAGDNAGTTITPLTNGNYVVNSIHFDSFFPLATDVGAVTWGNGNTGISGMVTPSNSLMGWYAWDWIGSGGIIPLNNGNYVVLSPYMDFNHIDVGAVTWCNGTTGRSGSMPAAGTLMGSNANDEVGSGGIQLLSNNNYMVLSPNWNFHQGAITWCNGTAGSSGTVSTFNSLVGYGCNSPVLSAGGDYYYIANPSWDNGSLIDVGAVTWGTGTSGLCGVISSSNSLIGSTAYDRVGSNVQILSTGNYVVLSPNWTDGAISKVGAVTFSDKNTPTKGFVSSSNSIIGSTVNDSVGSAGIIALGNGNFVVGSPNWDNGAIINAGAATLVSGTAGLSGSLNSSNSLVGNTTNDRVGLNVYSLSNSNYVVCSPNWTNATTAKAGAATFGDGITGITGIVNSSNSLVGSNEGDSIGSSGVVALSNGNYVVTSPNWNNGTGVHVSAATWGNGSTGTTGTVSSSNSLIGSTAGDSIGSNNNIVALNNGSFVIKSPKWDNGADVNAGAITWGSGTGSTTGILNSGNSLVGNAANPLTNIGVTRLTNGNFLVTNPNWNNGASTRAGAITWGSGTTGVSGEISSSNSLTGTASEDLIGNGEILTLSNGNFIVKSPEWDNGAVINAGAITWGNGSSGISGPVSSSNSLVGSADNPLTNPTLTLLSNDNYLVRNPNWNNGVITKAGAITWGDGMIGVSGLVSSNNSFVGNKINDSVGSGNLTILNNGGYIINSPNWDNGIATNAGAITLGNPNNGATGFISSCNSVTGTLTSGGSSLTSAYNDAYNYLIVGRPSENIISIFNPESMTMADMQDSITQNIYALTATPLIAAGGCRIIATLTPNGASPVSSAVKAKVWVESSVPTYQADPFVARHYEITPVTNAATATGKVTLYFTQQEFDDFNNHPASTLNLPTADGDATGIANLRIGKYPGSSNNGSGLPGTYSGVPVIIDPVDADIVWNGSLSRWEISFDVSGFSGFVIQTKATPLPLQWLSFSAALSQNDVLLNWTTANEINTRNFEVERSIDGRNFITVGTVAAINNTTLHNYNYTDAGAALLNAGKLYYRLKQIDNNDRYSNSQIVLLHLSKNNSITVYPNPVSNITILSFSNKALLNTVAVLIDVQGKQVQQFIIRNYQEQIDMSRLSNGVYMLKLADGTGVKLIKN